MYVVYGAERHLWGDLQGVNTDYSDSDDTDKKSLVLFMSKYKFNLSIYYNMDKN